MGLPSQIATVIKEAKQSKSVFASGAHRFAIESSEKFARQMRLKEQAEERGAKEQPPTEQEDLDSVEQAIVGIVSEQHATNRQTFEAEKRAYEQRRANVDIIGEARNSKLLANEAGSSFKASLANASLKITRAQENAQEADQALISFRERNQLSDPASAPNVSTAFGLLAFVLLIETVINGRLFAGASELGLLGGAGTAFFISLFNIALAVAAGFFALRQKNHVSRQNQVFGWLAVVVSIILLIAANLLAGHYRDVVVDGPEGLLLQEGQLALSRFLDSPLGIEDYMSWLLFGIGMIAALISLWKGYGLSDPYPGYLAKTTAKTRANDSLQRSREAYLRELKEGKEAARSDLETHKSRLRAERAELATVITGYNELCSGFKIYEAQLEQHARTLLSIYRDHNRAARSTPAPKHFDTTFELTRLPIVDGAQQNISKDIDSAIKEASDLLDKAIADIFDEYNTKVSVYATKDGLPQ